jgi:hypothetical protein
VQNIIAGWQTSTPWKDQRKLAAVTAAAAIKIARGQKPPTTGKVKTKGRGLGACIPDLPGADHEGELEAADQERLLQEV